MSKSKITVTCRAHGCMIVAHSTKRQCSKRALLAGDDHRHLLVRIEDTWARVCSAHWSRLFMAGSTSVEDARDDCF